MQAAADVGPFLLMILPHHESEEIMATRSSDYAPITDTVISYNEILDKVARRITLASARTIQRSWRMHKEGFVILEEVA